MSNIIQFTVKYDNPDTFNYWKNFPIDSWMNQGRLMAIEVGMSPSKPTVIDAQISALERRLQKAEDDVKALKTHLKPALTIHSYDHANHS